MYGRSCIEALETRVLLAANPGDQIPIRMIDGFPIATVQWDGKQVEMFAGRWMIGLDGYSGDYPTQQRRAAEAVARTDDTFEVQRFIGDGIFLVNAPQQMLPGEVQARLSQVPGFRYVVPDYRYETDVFPNDSFFNSQWGLHNTGQTGGINDVDIDAPEAWNTNTGNTSVVVGIADSGIDYNHPDLNDNIWINPGEIPGNGIDDDGNGYIDDWRGFDFFFNDNDPSDDSDHGSHVAGIAGAEGNNGTGISGVGWNIKIMALKVGSGFSISASAAVAAMFYVNNLKTRPVDPVNVRAVNHSWGGPGFDPGMNFIIGQHNTNGIMTVASAGNGGADGIGDNNDFDPRYPASYQQPNMLAVANHTHSNTRNISSNYGPTSVHLAAPGTNILSTIRVSSGSYAFFDGTSMSSPFVTGAVAVLFSAVPGATLAQVKNAILQGVDPVPAFSGLTITGGRLNLNNAMALIAPPGQLGAPDLTSSSDTGVSSADNITRDNTPTFQGIAQFGQTIKLYANGMQVGQAGVPPTNIYSVTASELPDGVYDFTVTATNANGEGPHSLPLQVTIDTVAPVPLSSFRFHNSPHSLNVAFGEDVSHSISDDDFGIINTGNNQDVPHAGTHNGTTHVTNLLLPGNNVLADGRYRLTIFASGPGGGITDVAGNALTENIQFNFLFMLGDANNDGRVNLEDFNIIAANFGQPNRDYSQGDLDYSGNVNLNDFNILASRFGQVIAPEPDATTAPLGGTRSIGSGGTLGGDDDPLGDLLA